jgi:HEAT repeat protein
LLVAAAATSAARPALGQAASDEEQRLSDPYLANDVQGRLRDLSSPDDGTRAEAAAALGEHRVSRAVRAIVRLLETDPSPSVRYAAAEALGNIGSPVGVDALIEALRAAQVDTSDEFIAQAAATALGQIGDPRAVPSLQQAMHDGRLNQHARGALEAIARKSPEAQRVLGAANRQLVQRSVRKLADPDPGVRAAACRVIAAYPDRSAVQPLIPLLRDGQASVRHEAARALGATKDAAAVEALLPLLADPAADVRSAAVHAVAACAGRQAVGPLIDALADKDKRVRAAAVVELGQLGGEQAVEALVRRVRDPAEAPGVRSEACARLGEVGGARAADALAEVLAGGAGAAVGDMRLFAALALGNLADPRAVEPLILVVRNRRNNSVVRGNAIRLLAALADARAVPVLKIASKDAEADVRAAAEAGLMQLKEEVAAAARRGTGTAPAPPGPGAPAAKDEAKARFLIKSGYTLLAAGKFAEARRYAENARKLAQEADTAAKAARLLASVTQRASRSNEAAAPVASPPARSDDPAP